MFNIARIKPAPGNRPRAFCIGRRSAFGAVLSLESGPPFSIAFEVVVDTGMANKRHTLEENVSFVPITHEADSVGSVPL
jgi:hypothetical protein